MTAQELHDILSELIAEGHADLPVRVKLRGSEPGGVESEVLNCLGIGGHPDDQAVLLLRSL